MAHKELVLLMLLGLVARGVSFTCVPCPEDDCGAPPSGCAYGTIKDVCGCCDMCASGPGDRCGPGTFYGQYRGSSCGHGLECTSFPCPECPPDHNPYFSNIESVCIHKWTPATNACIRGHNNLVLEGIVSLDDCKARCQAQTEFSCRSVEYHSNAKRCSLSDVNSSSNDYIQPCHAKHWWWTFTELNEWMPETNACIRDHNNLVLDGIFSLADCKARCQAQTEFSCRSIEYHSMSKRCSLSNATRTSYSPPSTTDPSTTYPSTIGYADDRTMFMHHSHYNQPCHDSGWSFTELIGRRVY